jgi:hypothetical protein
MQHKKYKKLKRYARFKRFTTRTWLYVKFSKMSNKPVHITEREQAIIEIITSLLIDRRSHLSVAPITGNRYIVSADERTQVLLTPINVVLSNHIYYYDIRLGSDAAKLIYNKFDRIMESRCKRIEAEIDTNVVSSLKKIASTSSVAFVK